MYIDIDVVGGQHSATISFTKAEIGGLTTTKDVVKLMLTIPTGIHVGALDFRRSGLGLVEDLHIINQICVRKPSEVSKFDLSLCDFGTTLRSLAVLRTIFENIGHEVAEIDLSDNNLGWQPEDFLTEIFSKLPSSVVKLKLSGDLMPKWSSSLLTKILGRDVEVVHKASKPSSKMTVEI